MSIQDAIKSLTSDELDSLKEWVHEPYHDHVLPNNLGTVKAVVNGKRENSSIYHVIEFDGVLYRLDGHYDSWNGTEWPGLDDLCVVEAKVKSITVYE